MKIKMSDLCLKTFALYIITKPLYLLDGVPFQIADIILIISFILVVFTKSRVKGQKITHIYNVVSIYAIIIGYQLIINVLFFLVVQGTTLESVSLLRNNLYYIFNFIAILYVYYLLCLFGDKVISAYVIGSCCSLFVTFIGLVINYGITGRNMSFFDNPNQLGYYALIMLTSIFVLNKHYKSWQKICVVVISAISLLLSSSKAAIFGAGILIICICLKHIYLKITKQDKNKISIKSVVTVLLIVAVLFLSYRQLINILDPYLNSFIVRLDQGYGSALSLGNSRGYSRIKEIGANIIWGQGEGAFYRYSVMPGNETHSSFATIIVSYGIIGCILYLILFFRTNRNSLKSVLNYLFVFSGIFFYWVSHNGLRNTLFWILAVLYCYYFFQLKDKSLEIQDET